MLIVNCDDFGMHNAVNAAVVKSIETGIASSCSLMVPCSAAADAMTLLRERPHIPFGINLALIRDSPEYGWGPAAAKADVPSLLDPDTDQLYVDTPAQRTAFLAAAKVTEVGRELRAQIDAVVDAGLVPTHLDWHCLADGGRTDILDLTMALAKEYRLAARVWLDDGRRKALPTEQTSRRQRLPGQLLHQRPRQGGNLRANAPRPTTGPQRMGRPSSARHRALAVDRANRLTSPAKRLRLPHLTTSARGPRS